MPVDDTDEEAVWLRRTANKTVCLTCLSELTHGKDIAYTSTERSMPGSNKQEFGRPKRGADKSAQQALDEIEGRSKVVKRSKY